VGTSTTITAAAANAITPQDIVNLGALSSTTMRFMRPEPQIAADFRSLTWLPHQAAAPAAAAPAAQTESIGWVLLHAAAPAAVPMVTLHSA
jgi:hypothetical protein